MKLIIDAKNKTEILDDTPSNFFTENELTIIKNMNRIAELKSLLASTDYQAIKFAEGELTDEEYEPVRLQRKAWREEIRSLGG